MIGKKIRELRIMLGFTQTELGAKVGVIKQTVSSWENGTSTPNYDILIALSSIFNVSTDFLLGNGIFKDWNILLKHKQQIIELMSISLEKLGEKISCNLDNISFAKLIQVFQITIEERSDGTGITLIDPITTYSNDISNEQAPLTNTQGELIIHRALKDTGLLSPTGELTNSGASILFDFISSNADILKKLIKNDK